MKMLFLCAIFLSNIAFCQDFNFEKLSIDDGLSQITASTIHQDHLNRIWIGTRDGLNCYDGVQIKSFRNEKENPNSLLGLHVSDIIQVEQDLWLLTEDGVSKLDLVTLNFTRFPVKAGRSLCFYNEEILLATDEGIYTLNKKAKQFEKTNKYLKNNYFTTELYKGADNQLYIGTMDDGIFRYDPHSKKAINHKYDHVKNIISIKEYKNEIWAGSYLNGILVLGEDLELKRHLLNNPQDPNSLVNNSVRTIHIDHLERIWVGTFGGISIYIPEEKKFKTVKSDPSNAASLSHNSVWSIMQDHQGSIWIGTYFGGVNYSNLDNNIFRFYYQDYQEENHLSHSVIGTMVEDDDKNMWIATEGGGLDFYNRKTGEFRNYSRGSGVKNLSENNVKSLYLDKELLYIGTHMGGLNVLDINSRTIKKYESFGENENLIVQSITPYDGKILLGTQNSILIFDPKDESMSYFFEDAQIRHKIGYNVNEIFEDSFGNIWIGADYLFKYDPKTKSLTNFADADLSIDNNPIFTITEDNQFRLWIGTLGGGLLMYDKRDSTFTNYNRKGNGIPSDIIYSIEESRFGNIWISTSQGLTRFDVENNRFFNYTQASGFPLNELNQNALLLTSKGELFVGGVNGMVSFDEEDLLKPGKPFNIIFSSLSVNNQQIKPLGASNILEKDIAFTKNLLLEPDHKTFAIQYAACNYISTYNCMYQYKLVGFDEEWVNKGYETTANYTNLSPGNYNFQVRAVDPVFGSILAENALSIKILPPIYRTWYAYVFYVVSVFGFIAWLNMVYLSKARLSDQLKLEKTQKKQIQELNQKKLNFFTDVSHEFITPLTIITGSLELMMETAKVPSSIFHRIVLAHKSASRLKKLAKELLDFRKLESGHLKIKVSENDFAFFLEEIYHAFSENAEHRQIKYTYRSSDEVIPLYFDPAQLEKVFYNLLANAFKYVTNKKGKIATEIYNFPDHVEVHITDNGTGIPAEKSEAIFDRFYQLETTGDKIAEQGTGIGLALSKGIIEEHHASLEILNNASMDTVFKVKILKGKAHFKEDQLDVPVPLEDEHIIKSKFKYSKVLHMVRDEPSVTLNKDAKSILIVENDADARQFLHNVLSAQYKIHEAEDGADGIEKALKIHPDLIISDVMMPNLSGTQMCAKLKRNVQTCHIPIILLTARASSEFKIEGLEMGADDYISKPVSMKLLKARITNIFKNRSLLQQKFNLDPNIQLSETTLNSIDQNFLEKARTFVVENIDNTEIDVSTFAKEMGLSRTKLYEKMKGVTGKTPNDFIQNIRLKKAATMLAESDELNISEIACMVGFSSQRYFSQCFRQHYGVIPSMYGKAKVGKE